MKEQLDTLNNARTQYRWAIANIAAALLCTALAAGAFMFGYVVAGVLVLIVSLALVVNSDLHRKRGIAAAKEAGLNTRAKETPPKRGKLSQ